MAISRISGITQNFSNGEIVFGFNSIKFLSCGCVGKCSFPTYTQEEHPNMRTWKALIDKQVGYYLPSWISYF